MQISFNPSRYNVNNNYQLRSNKNVNFGGTIPLAKRIAKIDGIQHRIYSSIAEIVDDIAKLYDTNDLYTKGNSLDTIAININNTMNKSNNAIDYNQLLQRNIPYFAIDVLNSGRHLNKSDDAIKNYLQGVIKLEAYITGKDSAKIDAIINKIIKEGYKDQLNNLDSFIKGLKKTNGNICGMNVSVSEADGVAWKKKSGWAPHGIDYRDMK